MYLVKENLVISEVEASLANGRNGEDLVGMPIVTTSQLGFAVEQPDLNGTEFGSNVVHISNMDESNLKGNDTTLNQTEQVIDSFYFYENTPGVADQRIINLL